MEKIKQNLKLPLMILICLSFVGTIIYAVAFTNKVFETDKIENIRTAHYLQSRNLMYKNGIITIDEDASRKNFTIKFLNKEGKVITKKDFTNSYTTYIQSDGEYLYLDISNIPTTKEVTNEDETYEYLDFDNASTDIVKLDGELNEVGRVKLTNLLGYYYDMYYLLGVHGSQNRFLSSINAVTGRYNLFHFNEDGSILLYTPIIYTPHNANDKIVCKDPKTENAEQTECNEYDFEKDADGNAYGQRYLLIDKEFKNVSAIEPTEEQKKIFANSDYEKISENNSETIWYSKSQKNNYTLKAGLYYAGSNFDVSDYFYHDDEENPVYPEAILTLYDGNNEKFTVQTKDYERFYNGEIMDDYIVVFAQKNYDNDNLDTLTNAILVYDFDGNLVDTIKDMTAYNQLKVEGNSFIVTGIYTEGCHGWVASTESRPHDEYEIEPEEGSEDNSCVRELKHVYYKFKTTEPTTPPPTTDIALGILIVFTICTIVVATISIKKINFIK